jgi:deoxyribonuclease-4
MIRFGPSGNSDEFYEKGYKHTYEAMKWLCDMGLNAFEYSFGRGVHLKHPTAVKIREEAARYDIAMSVHAPYYINLATDSEETRQKNVEYARKAAAAAKTMGATRMVVHPGGASTDRPASLKNIQAGLTNLLDIFEGEGYGVALCPETMGKPSQMGTLEEVVALCAADERLIPAIDFGHLHARSFGGIRSGEDFQRILDEIEKALGYDRLKNMHCHFSKIEFGASGEKKHVTFDDEGYGPDYIPLIGLMKERKLTPVIICESRGTMAKDALSMKTAYDGYTA